MDKFDWVMNSVMIAVTIFIVAMLGLGICKIIGIL